MKTVGLTGGIGSGKTTIGQWFIEKGIPVYNSDDEAKKLMNEDEELIAELTELFGDKTYVDGKYNRAFVSSQVFQNKDLLAKLNSIVHPAVFRHYATWIEEQQTANLIVKEAAILFESGSYKDCDWIISVVADEHTRIERVVKRDGFSEEQIRSRMRNQWTDEQRIEKSDFVIDNNGDLENLQNEFNRVYEELTSKIKCC